MAEPGERGRVVQGGQGRETGQFGFDAGVDRTGRGQARTTVDHAMHRRDGVRGRQVGEEASEQLRRIGQRRTFVVGGGEPPRRGIVREFEGAEPDRRTAGVDGEQQVHPHIPGIRCASV